MDGLLVIDKPEGWTSHDVVARVRRLLNVKRVGHTGTLDPFATGVLVVMVGRATRLAQFMAGDTKEYLATVRFGYATDTGDRTGTRSDEREAVTEAALSWGEDEIEAALETLRGEIEQIPPMYSAKKIAGKKLYELARRGEAVERTARRVTVHEFEALRKDNQFLFPREDGTCDLLVRVVCSSGTYVRALAESLGERLGVGAHLGELRRVRAGSFHLRDAVSLEELRLRAEAGTTQSALLSPDAALSSFPFLHLTVEEVNRVRHGVPVLLKGREAGPYRSGERVRLRDESGNLMAVGVYDPRVEALRPVVVIAPEK